MNVFQQIDTVVDLPVNAPPSVLPHHPFSPCSPPVSLSHSLFSQPSQSVSMKVLEVGDSVSQFRLAESCVGLAGCLCVAYSVWTPRWLNDQGLWSIGNNSTNTDSDGDQTGDIIFNGESRSYIDHQHQLSLCLTQNEKCLLPLCTQGVLTSVTCLYNFIYNVLN